MALSPFFARVSLLAFLAIGSGVGANLLALQTTSRDGSISRSRTPGFDLSTDADRLRQLASEAVSTTDGSSHTGRRPSREARRIGDVTVDGAIQRIGSFAPSSSQFSLSGLPGADPTEARRATIRGVQTELARRGYEPGAADGAAGLVTKAAVMAYEHDQGLPLTADPSPEVLAHLRHGTSAPGAAIGLDGTAGKGTGHAEQVIRSVQQALGHLGYLATPPDGLMSDETVRAIREHEMDSGLVPTGRISGPLVARLARHMGAQRSQ